MFKKYTILILGLILGINQSADAFSRSTQATARAVKQLQWLKKPALVGAAGITLYAAIAYCDEMAIQNASKSMGTYNPKLSELDAQDDAQLARYIEALRDNLNNLDNPLPRLSRFVELNETITPVGIFGFSSKIDLQRINRPYFAPNTEIKEKYAKAAKETSSPRVESFYKCMADLDSHVDNAQLDSQTSKCFNSVYDTVCKDSKFSVAVGSYYRR